MLRWFNNSMVRLQCEIVVAESCLLSSGESEWNTELFLQDCGVPIVYVCVGAIKCTNAIAVYQIAVTLIG